MIHHLSLKEMRHRNQYTAHDVAEHFDVHVNTVYNWESQPQNIKLGTVIQLLDYYGFSLTDLALPDQPTPTRK